jgi:hypothetical protein
VLIQEEKVRPSVGLLNANRKDCMMDEFKDLMRRSFHRDKKIIELEEKLLSLTPSRRYTREEVLQVRALTSGMVVGGLTITEMGELQEKTFWYQYEVTYSDDTFEILYFFKPLATGIPSV